jgi:NADPH:quinone reductase-like Zn-dependent oxidoreductase
MVQRAMSAPMRSVSPSEPEPKLLAPRSSDLDYVHALGADQVIKVQTARFEHEVKDIDVVIDTVGGETLDRSVEVLKPKGVLVSSVSTPDHDKAAR